MLSAVIPEYPVIHFNFLSALCRWIRGRQKVLKQPVRIELIDVETDLPDGPEAIIHKVYPADSNPRETYTHWSGRELNTKFTHFFERDAKGEIVRLIPDKEEAVPDEWKTSHL